MYGKAYRIITSVALIIIGVVITIEDKFYDRVFDYTFDFSSIRWIIGVPFIIIGIISTIYYSRQKPEKYGDIFLKCPSCYYFYRDRDIKDKKCPNCLSDLEPLKGFFERHPKGR